MSLHDALDAMTLCRFDGELAVAAYATPAGCVAYPDDKQQVLCRQHELKATPHEGMLLLAANSLWVERGPSRAAMKASSG